MEQTGDSGNRNADSSISSVGLIDNLRFNLCHVVPYYLRGIFTRNKFLLSLLIVFRIHPFSVRFVNHLRKRYGSDYFYINLLGKKSLLVLDVGGIKHVLDHSPSIYAEAGLKLRGMSHFQPNAVTISRGNAWAERRRFNEFVLDFGNPVHTDASHFLDAIRAETSSVLPASWKDFEQLFERVTMHIIFGIKAGEESGNSKLIGTLMKLMKESNRVFLLKKSKYFDDFDRRIRLHLQSSKDNSLVGRCRHTEVTPVTRPQNQIPHWIFAMNETLATNTARTLALIISHPEAEKRVRDEIQNADLSTVKGIDQLAYLEGCVQEAMRLWPSIPLLVRETTRRDRLGDRVIPAKTQILILNNFNHRDTKLYPAANLFRPEIWLNGQARYAYNHLSNGTQVCAGKELVLFIAKAVLAMLLDGNRYVLKKPVLKPDRPLPYQYNNYQLEFRVDGTS